MNIVPTLRANGANGGRYDKHPLTVNALDRQGGGPDDNSAQANHLIPVEQARCLTQGQRWDGETETFITHALMAEGFDASGAVRRLTPTECERLQSWPDGWTLPDGPSLADIPQHAARLADPHDPQPDGPRYAAAGDGVTSNVAEWIARRLLVSEEGRLAA